MARGRWTSPLSIYLSSAGFGFLSHSEDLCHVFGIFQNTEKQSHTPDILDLSPQEPRGGNSFVHNPSALYGPRFLSSMRRRMDLGHHVTIGILWYGLYVGRTIATDIVDTRSKTTLGKIEHQPAVC